MSALGPSSQQCRAGGRHGTCRGRGDRPRGLVARPDPRTEVGWGRGSGQLVYETGGGRSQTPLGAGEGMLGRRLLSREGPEQAGETRSQEPPWLPAPSGDQDSQPLPLCRRTATRAAGGPGGAAGGPERVLCQKRGELARAQAGDRQGGLRSRMAAQRGTGHPLTGSTLDQISLCRQHPPAVAFSVPEGACMVWRTGDSEAWGGPCRRRDGCGLPPRAQHLLLVGAAGEGGSLSGPVSRHCRGGKLTGTPCGVCPGISHRRSGVAQTRFLEHETQLSWGPPETRHNGSPCERA